MGGNRQREKGSFGGKCGGSIVTNKDFLALLIFPAVKGGDAALPKLLWDFLFRNP